MKMKTLLITIFFVFTQALMAKGQGPAEILQEEFKNIHELVQELKPEFVVGGLLKGKRYGDVELLWDANFEEDGTDIIRIYHEHKDGTEDFAVAYHRSRYIVPGRTVIRRFVGPLHSGWRNDTVDVFSGEYLGHQGVELPQVSQRDRQIFKEWGVQLF